MNIGSAAPKFKRNKNNIREPFLLRDFAKNEVDHRLDSEQEKLISNVITDDFGSVLKTVEKKVIV